MQTELGLPLLRDNTLDSFIRESNRSASPSEVERTFYEDIFVRLRSYDRLHTRLIHDLSNFYSGEEREYVLNALTSAFEMLSREGQLPHFDEEIYSSLWKAKMRDRSDVSIAINSADMDLIRKDNEEFHTFIVTKSEYLRRLTGWEPRMGVGPHDRLKADMCTAYMFLVDSVSS